MANIIEKKPGVHGFSTQPRSASRSAPSGDLALIQSFKGKEPIGKLASAKKAVDKGIDLARQKAGLGDRGKMFDRLSALNTGKPRTKQRHVSAAELEAQRAASRLRSKAGF